MYIKLGIILHNYTCICDEQIAGDASFNNVHLASILSSCEAELRKNMTLYVVSSDTGVATPPVEQLSNICDSDCNRNGDCVNSEYM